MCCRRFEFTVESFASVQDSKGTNTPVNQMAALEQADYKSLIPLQAVTNQRLELGQIPRIYQHKPESAVGRQGISIDILKQIYCP
jgi:hypothetical protein